MAQEGAAVKRVRCKCGEEHECAARLSNLERATKAARARLPRITNGTIETSAVPAQCPSTPDQGPDVRADVAPTVEQPTRYLPPPERHVNGVARTRTITKEQAAEEFPKISPTKKHGCVSHRQHQAGCKYCEL